MSGHVEFEVCFDGLLAAGDGRKRKGNHELTCHKCGQAGHVVKDCPLNRKKGKWGNGGSAAHVQEVKQASIATGNVKALPGEPVLMCFVMLAAFALRQMSIRALASEKPVARVPVAWPIASIRYGGH